MALGTIGALFLPLSYVIDLALSFVVFNFHFSGTNNQDSGIVVSESTLYFIKQCLLKNLKNTAQKSVSDGDILRFALNFH